jgi:hypothetical protein
VTNINSVIAQRLLKNTCIYNNSDISKTFTTTISNDDVLQRDSRCSGKSISSFMFEKCVLSKWFYDTSPYTVTRAARGGSLIREAKALLA